jgi:hypothetical protein
LRNHEPGLKHTAADPILEDEQIKKRDGGWRDGYEGSPSSKEKMEARGKCKR